MIDLEPAKEIITRYTGYVVILGFVLAAGNLLFKKLGKSLRKKRR
jgi:hypothetical protein